MMERRAPLELQKVKHVGVPGLEVHGEGAAPLAAALEVGRRGRVWVQKRSVYVKKKCRFLHPGGRQRGRVS